MWARRQLPKLSSGGSGGHFVHMAPAFCYDLHTVCPVRGQGARTEPALRMAGHCDPLADQQNLRLREGGLPSELSDGVILESQRDVL